MARRPNVAVKASALPCHSAQDYPFADLHARIEQVYDVYGPHRMFWGSDLTRLPCAYRRCIDLFTTALPFLSDQDKDWIMGRGILSWLG